MTPDPIPVEIDVQAIVAELRAMGWKDQKIEIICGFSGGYIAKLDGGPRPNRPYQYLARLYNFWAHQVSDSAARQTTEQMST